MTIGIIEFEAYLFNNLTYIGRNVNETKEYNSLIMFCGLVLILEWALSVMVYKSFPMAIGLITFTPTISALLVALFKQGRSEFKKFVSKIFVLSYPKWIVYAILIPTAIHVTATLIAMFLGEVPQFSASLFLMYAPVTLVLAAGEEIGWQGYMVPIIRKKNSQLLTTILFGVFHAVFHLPMYLLPIPTEMRQASSFWLFAIMAISFSYFRVVLFDETDGNLFVAILYHAAINNSIILLNGVSRGTMAWLVPFVWLIAFISFYMYIYTRISKRKAPIIISMNMKASTK